MNGRKNLALLVDGVGIGPQISAWTRARGWDALDIDNVNGNLWFLAY